MPPFAATPDLSCCPFIDAADPRCESHFSIGRLSEAFGDCFGDYHRCPTFARLNDQRRSPRHGPAPETFAALTRHGRRVQSTRA